MILFLMRTIRRIFRLRVDFFFFFVFFFFFFLFCHVYCFLYTTFIDQNLKCHNFYYIKVLFPLMTTCNQVRMNNSLTFELLTSDSMLIPTAISIVAVTETGCTAVNGCSLGICAWLPVVE
jgi:hypothetical protein